MIRRYVEVAGFVGTWMVLGWGLGLDANTYILLGVPLALAFQMIIGKRPIVDMWVRGAATIRLDAVSIVLAIVIAFTPVYSLVTSYERMDWASRIWFCCAAAGAIPAAFAIRNQRRDHLITALPSALFVLVAGCALFTLAATTAAHRGSLSIWSLIVLVEQFAIYFSCGLPAGGGCIPWRAGLACRRREVRQRRKRVGLRPVRFRTLGLVALAG
jgi:hypothetical protein